MKIHLVNYEMSSTSQILSKFAWKMSEELDKLGLPHSLSDMPDPKADVNHHIIYNVYQHVDSLNTVMITHIDTEAKLGRLAAALKTADKGICMSHDQMQKLIDSGISAEKLAVILPAHDGEIIRIPVAILTNVYEDGRKREYMLNELAKHIDPRRFLFRIMGQNWDIPALERLGLTVEYYPTFDRTTHATILQNSKYYLYMGLDEGSMGSIDAKRAGLGLIATPQGFHIELGVDHPFMTQEELTAIFLELQKPALPEWTWEHYTKQHVALWEKLYSHDNS
jgi:hypothetical protein